MLFLSHLLKGFSSSSFDGIVTTSEVMSFHCNVAINDLSKSYTSVVIFTSDVAEVLMRCVSTV